MMIRVGIVDDQPMIAAGLRSLFAGSQTIELVYSSNNGFGLLQHLRQGLCIDLLLLDMEMPVINGYESALMLRKEFPGLKIIIFSLHFNHAGIDELKANKLIDGFLSKTATRTEIEEAIVYNMRS